MKKHCFQRYLARGRAEELREQDAEGPAVLDHVLRHLRHDDLHHLHHDGRSFRLHVAALIERPHSAALKKGRKERLLTLLPVSKPSSKASDTLPLLS